MTTERHAGSPAIAAFLAFAFLFVASSCGPAASSAKLPTPSINPTPASPPPGGPVPAQLIGVWILDTPHSDPSLAIGGVINGKVQLTLTATTWRVEGLNNPAFMSSTPFTGDVVVHNTEFDIFNGSLCGIHMPDGGVGRYTWTLTGRILHFTPLVRTGYYGDPCGHVELANQSYIRSH